MDKAFLLAFLIPCIAYSQLPTKDGKIFYTNVVSVDSASKSDLYKRSKNWFEHAYYSPKNVIQSDDSAAGNITGRGNFEFQVLSNTASVYYSINVYVKDDKYKYEITDFICFLLDEKFPAEQYPKLWGSKKKFYERLDAQVKELEASLQKAMSKNADNW